MEFSLTTAFVFPGQGSQSIGMLADFASEAPVIDTFREASEILGYDLWSYAQNGPQEWMTLTTNTQPLIYTASVALLRLLAPELSEISCVAGHSLGEYAALVAAQSLSFESGLRLIAFRAQAMHEAFPAGQGAMAAVMGLTPEVVTYTVREISPTVEAVNFNSPQQIVIAGYVEGLTKAEALLKEKGARRVLRLNVSGPFHSSLMNQARERLAQRLATETFAEASISVVQNYNATPTTDA
ncbi:MAG TPA: malonyl CoA-acyl carrier protein transacylase, partial [Sutterella sp.]|nr:malonyl CoA-acyl carrier protein transacylase [Sutterella sp.]